MKTMRVHPVFQGFSCDRPGERNRFRVERLSFLIHTTDLLRAEIQAPHGEAYTLKQFTPMKLFSRSSDEAEIGRNN